MSEANGIVNRRSRFGVDETVARLEETLRAKGLRLFALVDHSGEAQKVGLTMAPTRLLIFGSPAAGTPVMIAAPSAAIDLPLKLLVWEDPAGVAWISWNSAAYLQQRHGVPPALAKVLGAPEALAADLLAED